MILTLKILRVLPTRGKLHKGLSVCVDRTLHHKFGKWASITFAFSCKGFFQRVRLQEEALDSLPIDISLVVAKQVIAPSPLIVGFVLLEGGDDMVLVVDRDPRPFSSIPFEYPTFIGRHILLHQHVHQLAVSKICAHLRWFLHSVWRLLWDSAIIRKLGSSCGWWRTKGLQLGLGLLS